MSYYVLKKVGKVEHVGNFHGSGMMDKEILDGANMRISSQNHLIPAPKSKWTRWVILCCKVGTLHPT